MRSTASGRAGRELPRPPVRARADLPRASPCSSSSSRSGCSPGSTTRSRTGSRDGDLDRGRPRLEAVPQAVPADAQAGGRRQDARPEDQRLLLGARRRDVHRRAGRGHRADGAQRLRQEHAAQARHGRDAPDLGPGPHPRPGLRPDRDRRRLPPADDRPREHLHERRHPRHDRGRDRREVRRDRRVRRASTTSWTPRSATTPRACSPGSGSRSRCTSTATCSSPTRCSPSATSRSRRSA